MPLDRTPILPDGPPDFWVEVWNDDNTDYIRISEHSRFDPAVAAFVMEAYKHTPEQGAVAGLRAKIEKEGGTAQELRRHNPRSNKGLPGDIQRLTLQGRGILAALQATGENRPDRSGGD